jgi:hypothetical protein
MYGKWHIYVDSTATATPRMRSIMDRHMKRPLLRPFAAIALAALFSLAPSRAADRGPSTPEERQRAVSVARELESDPLGPTAHRDREWVLRFLIEAPDIHVKVCAAFLRPLLGAKKNFSSEYLAQMLISDAAFGIRNPDQAGDQLARYTAGLEGVLKAYRAVLKSQPEARWPFLDDLIRKREAGTLGDFVRETMGQCEGPAKAATP